MKTISFEVHEELYNDFVLACISNGVEIQNILVKFIVSYVYFYTHENGQKMWVDSNVADFFNFISFNK